jgi:hypothetical protein
MDTTPRLVALHSANFQEDREMQQNQNCTENQRSSNPHRPPGERTMYLHRIKIRYRYIGVLTNSILESCVHNLVIFHYGPPIMGPILPHSSFCFLIVYVRK